MSAPQLPVSPSERILTLDVVRGVALLGIFIMNVPGFSSSFFAGADGSHPWPEWWNRTAEVFRDVLFSGKFNSMFSMLFAVGFTIQLERLLTKDGSGMAIYVRRLVWLFVFGLIHACVFWTGDVLHMYALLGFALLLIRKWPDRVIVSLIVACLLYAPVMGIIRFYTVTPDEIDRAVQSALEWEARDNLAFGAGNFFSAAKQNVRIMSALYSDPEFLRGTIGFYVQISTTMLLGLLLGRRAFFQRAHAYLPLVKTIQWFALALGIVTGAVFGVWQATVENPAQPSVWRIAAGTSYSLCRVSLMCFYVATLVRGVHSDRWRSRLQVFALAGRMPLTNYLLQTLLATFFFFHWGLGFWNRIGPAAGIVFAVVVYFAIQLPLTRWWLKHHDIGPFEYLWRILSYGRTRLQSASASKVTTATSAS